MQIQVKELTCLSAMRKACPKNVRSPYWWTSRFILFWIPLVVLCLPKSNSTTVRNLLLNCIKPIRLWNSPILNSPTRFDKNCRSLLKFWGWILCDPSRAMKMSKFSFRHCGSENIKKRKMISETKKKAKHYTTNRTRIF